MDIEKIVERVNFENKVSQIDDRILKIRPEIWVVSFTDWTIGEEFFGSKLDLPGVIVDIRMWDVFEPGKSRRILQSKDLDLNLKNYIDIKKGTLNFIASDYDMFDEFEKIHLNKDKFKKKKEYNLIKNQKITYYFKLYDYHPYKTVQELLNEDKLELSDINLIKNEINEIMKKIGDKNIFYDDFHLDNVLFDEKNKKVILIDLDAFKENIEGENYIDDAIDHIYIVLYRVKKNIEGKFLANEIEKYKDEFEEDSVKKVEKYVIDFYKKFALEEGLSDLKEILGDVEELRFELDNDDYELSDFDKFLIQKLKNL